MTRAKLIFGALLLATAGAAAPAPAQPLSPEDLARRTIERRAIEAVIWGMPAVNTDLMYQAMLKLGGKPNQIVYWPGLLDWKNQTLTPNPDVIYLMAFFNTNVKAYKEFAAENRPEGWNAWLTFAISPRAPEATAPKPLQRKY